MAGAGAIGFESDDEGPAVGRKVGLELNRFEGAEVGRAVGTLDLVVMLEFDGVGEGPVVGDLDLLFGLIVGLELDSFVGTDVGDVVGNLDLLVGEVDGFIVGFNEALFTGDVVTGFKDGDGVR